MTDRSALRDALLKYQPYNATEATFLPKFLELLEFSNCYERSLLHAHITASSWVLNYDMTAVLMLHHAKLNRWLQPGGHADGDENLVRVAKKELMEETALKAFTLIEEKIFDIDIHLIPERKGVPAHDHYDVRWAFHASEDASIMGNHESNALSWVPLEETPDEESIQRMVTKTQLWLQ